MHSKTQICRSPEFPEPVQTGHTVVGRSLRGHLAQVSGSSESSLKEHTMQYIDDVV